MARSRFELCILSASEGPTRSVSGQQRTREYRVAYRHLSTPWTVDEQTLVLPCLYVYVFVCGLMCGQNSARSMRPCRCGWVVIRANGIRDKGEWNE